MWQDLRALVRISVIVVRMADPQKPASLLTSNHPGCGLALILATILCIGLSSLLAMFLFEW